LRVKTCESREIRTVNNLLTQLIVAVTEPLFLLPRQLGIYDNLAYLNLSCKIWKAILLTRFEIPLHLQRRHIIAGYNILLHFVGLELFIDTGPHFLFIL